VLVLAHPSKQENELLCQSVAKVQNSFVLFQANQKGASPNMPLVSFKDEVVSPNSTSI
jgi:hypothetical protein